MIEFEIASLLNYAWTLMVIPIGIFIKQGMKTKFDKEKELKEAMKKARESVNREEVEKLVKELLIPLLTKQGELENDFKLVNKELSNFVIAFYDKINDVTLKLMDK